MAVYSQKPFLGYILLYPFYKGVMVHNTQSMTDTAIFT